MNVQVDLSQIPDPANCTQDRPKIKTHVRAWVTKYANPEDAKAGKVMEVGEPFEGVIELHAEEVERLKGMQ